MSDFSHSSEWLSVLFQCLQESTRIDRSAADQRPSVASRREGPVNNPTGTTRACQQARPLQMHLKSLPLLSFLYEARMYSYSLLRATRPEASSPNNSNSTAI